MNASSAEGFSLLLSLVTAVGVLFGLAVIAEAINQHTKRKRQQQEP